MVKDRTPGCDGLSPTWLPWLPWLPCGVGLHRTAAGSAPDVRVWPSLPVWHTRERGRTGFQGDRFAQNHTGKKLGENPDPGLQPEVLPTVPRTSVSTLRLFLLNLGNVFFENKQLISQDL